jgi:transposase-like protein
VQCHCCSGPCKKIGFYENRNRSVQRFLCRRCGKSFSESQPLNGTRIETDKAAFVVKLLCEGVGVRAVSRLTGLNSGTVLNVLVSAGEHCQRLLDELVVNIKPRQIEVDELYSFVRTRPDNTPVSDTEHGEFYLYLALDRDTKLIVAHHVAKRNRYHAATFLHDLKKRVASRFQLSTDGWAGYVGWAGGVLRVFGDNIDYGSEVKDFGPAVTGHFKTSQSGSNQNRPL